MSWSFSVHDSIEVHLTDTGLGVLRLHDEINGTNHESRLQFKTLWNGKFLEFMAVFGEALIIGGNRFPLFKDNCINVLQVK